MKGKRYSQEQKVYALTQVVEVCRQPAACRTSSARC
jgi:hypothetical protein